MMSTAPASAVALVGGQPVDRYRRRVGAGQPGRDGGQPLGWAGHVLGVTAGQAGVAVDRLAVVESGLVTAVTLDQSGELGTGDVRPGAAPPAAAQVGVPGPDSSREDPDQDLAAVRPRDVGFADPQYLGSAWLADHDRLHLASCRLAAALPCLGNQPIM